MSFPVTITNANGTNSGTNYTLDTGASNSTQKVYELDGDTGKTKGIVFKEQSNGDTHLLVNFGFGAYPDTGPPNYFKIGGAGSNTDSKIEAGQDIELWDNSNLNVQVGGFTVTSSMIFGSSGSGSGGSVVQKKVFRNFW
jgi:hypothetical protein